MRVRCLICHRDDPEQVAARMGRPLSICRHCGFLYMSDQPPPEEIKAFYDLRYWGEYQTDLGLLPAAQRLEQDKAVGRLRWQSARRIYERIHGVGPIDGERVPCIDIGCGTGMLLQVADEERSGIGPLPHGIELDEGVAAQAQAWSGCPVGAFDLARELSVVLRWCRSQTLTVFFNDVVEHTPFPDALLFGAGQLLQDRGLLVVEMPSRSTQQAIYGGREWKHLKYEHIWNFHAHELQQLIIRNGFTVVETLFPVPGRMVVYAIKGVDRELSKFQL